MKWMIGLFLCIGFSISAFSNENVATVLLKKGDVRAKLRDGKLIAVKEEQSLPEGAIVMTSARSFVKLIFIDKSQINVGPSSQMEIQAFPRKEAGIIKLIKGQMRAEVTKNYMEMSDKSKSKLYIQTKTAAMGIRGTDFQVNYNPENQNSSLIVFEGKVAMSNIDRSSGDEVLDQNKLESIVSNSTAVLVKQGQISAVNLNISDRALIPAKLAPKQLDALKESPTGLEGNDGMKPNRDSSKKYRDVVPPGGDSALFLNVNPETLKAERSAAQGYFNERTREYQPAAGVIIDLKTVNVIPPPTDAAFDHATKTFIVGENYGKIDEKTGQYKAPTGYQLSNEGKFAPIPRKEGERLPKTPEQSASTKVAEAPPVSSETTAAPNKGQPAPVAAGPSAQPAPVVVAPTPVSTVTPAVQPVPTQVMPTTPVTTTAPTLPKEQPVPVATTPVVTVPSTPPPPVYTPPVQPPVNTTLPKVTTPLPTTTTTK